MPNQNRNIELRSEEVQEIMSHVPTWTIRWGITLIFVLILLMLSLTWIIKYPDVISANATLSTEQPVIKIVSKNAGEIDQIMVEDKQWIEKGEIIATVENNLSQASADQLRKLCTEIKLQLEEEKVMVNWPEKQVFGALQEQFIQLKRSAEQYELFQKDISKPNQLQSLESKISYQQQLLNLAVSELKVAKRQLKLEQEQYGINSELYQNKVISKTQLMEEEKKLIMAEANVNNIEKSNIQGEVTLLDLKNQHTILSQEYQKEKESLMLELTGNLSSLENSIVEVGRNYELKALVGGKVSFLQTLAPNEYVEAGKELFAILPENQDYIGYLSVPKQGYGKVEVGQSVRIKLDNYPFHEYGVLMGEVSDVSLLAKDENYQVQFKLVNGLKTTYDKEVEFAPEMSGAAEIITDDYRLIERIFNQFSQVLE